MLATISSEGSAHHDVHDVSRDRLPHSRVAFLASMTSASTRNQTTAPPRAPKSSAGEKTITDVVAGAVARAASQSTIHPLDTLKVRLQAGYKPDAGAAAAPGMGAFRGFRVNAATAGLETPAVVLRQGLAEICSLYKGVLSAATGAGIIIGAYFACYSTTKRFLRERTTLADGSVAFVAGATAAVGSSVVKVPIAVCIRSVQAGVYPTAIHAARSIVRAAGPSGLFTGFLPTLMEDVPDMAVKFAVYETLRPVHQRLSGGREPTTAEDLLMGGTAGAAAAAATTPLDVVKTRMMCSASSRPTLIKAVRAILAEGQGARAFFRGVGPRALSNGLNSAVFFCFFEAIRKVLIERQQQSSALHHLQPHADLAEGQQASKGHRGRSGSNSSGAPAACLTLARTRLGGWEAQRGSPPADVALWQQPLDASGR